MGNLFCCDNNRHTELEFKHNILDYLSHEKIRNKTVENTDYDYYSNLKITKMIHNNNTTVYLLENNIVKKQYNLSISSNRVQFLNEVKTYILLKKLKFILKPLYIDIVSGSIYLPYIEGVPIKNSENKQKVQLYLDIIRQHYGIHKRGEYFWGNILQDVNTDQIYLIDFGNIPLYMDVPNTNWLISATRS
jgi:hypothetical protein